MNYSDNYRKWLDNCDDEGKRELRSIEGNDKEIRERFTLPLAFGTAGMRGTIAYGIANMNGYTETTLTTRNIDVINVPEGKTADLSTASLQVRVVGTAAQVSRLTGDSVFCTVDLSSIGDQSGNLEVPVTVTINNAESCWATGTYTAHVTVSNEAPSSSSEAE